MTRARRGDMARKTGTGRSSHLSRIPLSITRSIDSEDHRFVAGEGHVWSISVIGDCGAEGRVGGVGAFGRSWGGGPSTGGSADVGRLDEPRTGRSVWRDGGLGSALAAVVCRRWCGGFALDAGAGSVAG